MDGIVGIIISVIVAAVVFWLLGYIIPVWISALIAVALFLVLVFGAGRSRRGAL